MGQSFSTALPNKASTEVDINAQIETLEHSASIAGMKAQACKGAARQCILSKQFDSAKERYTHFRGYEGQQANLLKAITALHSQRMTLDAAETNAIVLHTLKATTQRTFKHPLIDSDEVDRITDAIHARGDRVDEDTNQLQTIGSNSHIKFDRDEEWLTFMTECDDTTTMSGLPPKSAAALPEYNIAEPPPAFPAVPIEEIPTTNLKKEAFPVPTIELLKSGSQALL